MTSFTGLILKFNLTTNLDCLYSVVILNWNECKIMKCSSRNSPQYIPLTCRIGEYFYSCTSKKLKIFAYSACTWDITTDYTRINMEKFQKTKSYLETNSTPTVSKHTTKLKPSRKTNWNCYHCNNSNHLAKDCRSKNLLKCFKCQKCGYTTITCPDCNKSSESGHRK